MTEKVKKLAELHYKGTQISDRYYVFATPVPESRMGGDPHRVAEFYRRRWGSRTLASRTTTTYDEAANFLLWKDGP